MVRAARLQTTPSGSYYNASQGGFATVTVTSVVIPIQLSASRVVNGLMLSWNSQSGVVYRVQARPNLNPSTWVDVSGSIAATGSGTSWTDTNFNSLPQRFYRVASP
jgi:hypothetical protein